MGCVMISEADVRAGKCFLTAGSKPQVLRVCAVRDGVVEFEALAQAGRAGRNSRGEAPTAEFLAGLTREVGCDHQPGRPDRIHI